MAGEGRRGNVWRRQTTASGVEADETPLRRALRRAGAAMAGWLVLAVFFAGSIAVMNLGAPAPMLETGKPAPSDIRARVSFMWNDMDSINARREKIRRETPRVYEGKSDWTDRVLGRFRRLVAIAEESPSPTHARDRAEAEGLAAERDLAGALANLKSADDGPRLLRAVLDCAEAAVRELDERGVMKEEDRRRELSTKYGRLEILKASGGIRSSREVDSTFTIQTAHRHLMGRFDAVLPSDSRRLSELLSSYFSRHLTENLVFDQRASAEELQRRLASVESTEMVEVRKDETIINAGDLVTAYHIRKLREEDAAYRASLGWEERLREQAGIAAFVGAALLIMLLWICLASRGILDNVLRWGLMGALALGVIGAARWLAISDASIQLTPVPLLAMVAAIVFGGGTAIAVAFAASLAAACAAGMSLTVFVSLLSGASVGALVSSKVRRRVHLFYFGLYAGVVQAVVVLGLYLLPGSYAPRQALLDAGSALACGIACGFFLMGALPFVEKAFGVLTNISLLELCDQNQPALRRLLMEAPGTYHHSLRLANLCEPTADAVGADSLLIRAGCYYHDFGKVLKPEYFVENQAPGARPHEGLSPIMSTLIITAHVKDGIELARQYGLPPAIVDFIPQHHGTSLVSYFYLTAKERADRPEEVQEGFFRYPGPKPQTKEAAILMLADGIEAASRTLEHPTPTKLEKLVDGIFRQKIEDGQLDECGLTFRDQKIIRDTMVRMLCGMFHMRIRYPGQLADDTGGTRGNGGVAGGSPAGEKSDGSDEGKDGAREKEDGSGGTARQTGEIGPEGGAAGREKVEGAGHRVEPGAGRAGGGD
ncbi:MAG: HDIG domain-containing protein [Planctomycetota bacterium]|nr:HDIG domain-containing protein [Planctomycetota bacterium]